MNAYSRPTKVQPLWMSKRCTTCGAEVGAYCRELTRAPLAIKKTKGKRVAAIMADSPIRAQPHESRLNAVKHP